MNRTWTNLLLTAVVALIFGFGGSALAVRTLLPKPPRGIGVRESVDQLLLHEMQLTPTQKAALQTLDQRYAAEDNRVWADIRMSNAELSLALANDMSMNPAVQAAVNGVVQNAGRFQMQTIQYVLDVRGILTPQQRMSYDERVQKALARGPE